MSGPSHEQRIRIGKIAASRTAIQGDAWIQASSLAAEGYKAQELISYMIIFCYQIQLAIWRNIRVDR
jgi:hypothetical protein